jgi:glycosyltransferase involved in cell wall biosynthesis
MNEQSAERKLKISIIAPDLSGGGGTRAYLLSQVIRKLNYDVKVFGFLFKENLYPVPPSDLTVCSVPGYDYPKLFTSAKQLIDQIDGDILYAVKPRATSFGVGLLKKISSQRPLILDMDDWELSWHGGDECQYRPTLKQFARDLLKTKGALRNPDHPQYLKWAEKLVSKADAVTVDTKFLQNRFGGTYLPNGKDTALFDPERFDPEASRVIHGLSEYKILMFPGTARPHKGLEDVLKALDFLNQPDLRLVIVGGRDIGDGYIEHLLANWGRWIIRLPQFPIEKMPEIVSAAHLVVVPQQDVSTAKAQFPIKLTDAMAMAKPILSTTVGDIPEILKGVGYLTKPNSPEAMAEKIKYIFQNLEEANELGKMARARCIQDYSTDAMATTLSQLISGLSKN